MVMPLGLNGFGSLNVLGFRSLLLNKGFMVRHSGAGFGFGSGG